MNFWVKSYDEDVIEIIASDVNLEKFIKIEADLDFGTLSSLNPIANGGTAFSGVIDGNNKIIQGLVLPAINQDFSLIKNATGNAVIKNLVLKNFELTSTTNKIVTLVQLHTSGTLRLENLTLDVDWL